MTGVRTQCRQLAVHTCLQTVWFRQLSL